MTFHNSVRIGRLLEDLDIFAVCVCYQHIQNPKQVEGMPSSYSIVTALVDQIDISEAPLRVSQFRDDSLHCWINSIEFSWQHDADIRLRGHVTWVGRSSMEATMEVDQKDPERNEWQTFTKARFVMVSRDPLNKGSAIVNRLIAETDEEKALFKKGEGIHLIFLLWIISWFILWNWIRE